MEMISLSICTHENNCCKTRIFFVPELRCSCIIYRGFFGQVQGQHFFCSPCTNVCLTLKAVIFHPPVYIFFLVMTTICWCNRVTFSTRHLSSTVPHELHLWPLGYLTFSPHMISQKLQKRVYGLYVHYYRCIFVNIL